MNMIYVTPADGARVRMPEKQSKVMPPVGDWVPRSVHYETLLACGDVILDDPQPPLPTAEPAEAEPAKSAPPAPPVRNPRPASKER